MNVLRWSILVMIGLVFYARAFAADDQIQQLSATPAMIELTAWCQQRPCERRPALTRIAQAHCQANGRNARLVESYVLERRLFDTALHGYFRYDCVR